MKWDRSYPVLSLKSKATSSPYIQSGNLPHLIYTSICEIDADEVPSNMFVHIFLFDVAASFGNEHSQFELMIDPVYF